MLEIVRRTVAVPRLRVDIVLATATAFSFGWLLLRDLLHPVAVYLLQLYLAF